MQKFSRYFFAVGITCLICLTILAFWYSTSVNTQADSSVLPTVQTISPNSQKTIAGEILLSETENAYNPIPNSDGSLIAYVRTGWNREGGSGGFGRSNLVSEVAVMNADGNVLTKQSLADAFLQGLSSDGKSLICSRDGNYSVVSFDGKVLTAGRLPEASDFHSVSENVAFFSNTNSVLWLQNDYTNVKRTQTSPGAYSINSDFVSSAIQSSKGEVVKFNSQINVNAVLIPSPNEKYLALVGRNNLQVYDIQNASWTNLGEIIIHPSDDWNYIKPTWNPWFADSSRLIFLTASGIVVSSPDGKSKHTIYKPKGASGLVTPSPDGNYIAFATFEPRPMKMREDLKFWGGSQLWVVPVTENSKARFVSQKNSDTTLSLRWLNNHALIFDRIANETFYKKARLWKVEFSE
jgi:hypothetical protein